MTGHRGRRRGRMSLIAVAAVTALSALTACGTGGGEGDSDGKVDLSLVWWGDPDRAARYQEAVKLFEKDHPDIDVKPTFQDWDPYWTARSTEAASHSLPDVFQMDLSYLREYAANGQILDLSEYVDDQIDLSGFDETLVQAGQIDGKQVGIPISTNTLALFVNKDLADQAGVEMLPEDYTWEDYNTWVKQVTDAGVQTKGHQVYGGADYAGTMWLFMEWLLQNGIEPFSEDGDFNFTEDDVREYLELSSGLREADAVFPAKRTAQVAPLDGFQTEEQASSMTWDNFMATYDTEVGGNIEILPVPTGPEGEKSMFWKPSMLYSVGANTEHPEEAAELVDFLLTEPEVGKIFGTSQGVRADEGQRAAVKPEPGSVDAKVTAFEQDVSEHVTAPVPVPIQGFGTLEATWLRLGQDLSYGKISVDEFVDQWFSEAEMATQ